MVPICKLPIGSFSPWPLFSGGPQFPHPKISLYPVCSILQVTPNGYNRLKESKKLPARLVYGFISEKTDFSSFALPKVPLAIRIGYLEGVFRRWGAVKI